jgi:hypothetical protein
MGIRIQYNSSQTGHPEENVLESKGKRNNNRKMGLQKDFLYQGRCLVTAVTEVFMNQKFTNRKCSHLQINKKTYLATSCKRKY